MRRECVVARRSYFGIVRIHRFDAGDFARLSPFLSRPMATTAIFIADVHHRLGTEHVDDNEMSHANGTYIVL